MYPLRQKKDLIAEHFSTT